MYIYLGKTDTKNQQPMEYAVVDKNKKKKKDDKQQKVHVHIISSLTFLYYVYT